MALKTSPDGNLVTKSEQNWTGLKLGKRGLNFVKNQYRIGQVGTVNTIWSKNQYIIGQDRTQIGQERTQFGHKIRTELDRTGLKLDTKSVQSIR